MRKVGSERIDHSMRVKFNPLALLLDSSLEGEFDLVQRIIYEVSGGPLWKHAAINRSLLCEALLFIDSWLINSFSMDRWRIPANPMMKESLLFITLFVPVIQRLSSFWFSLGSM